MTHYRPAPGIAWLVGADFMDEDTAVYLMRVPRGHPVVLDGSASVIWQAALVEGDTVALVAEAAGVDAATVAGDVTAFLGQLVADGYLERVEPEEDAT